MHLNDQQRDRLEQALGRTGQRSTRQREHVFSVILSKLDHPTADEVFARAREEMPSISLATVYNCLDTLVESGLVRQVNFERDSTRFCPNVREHAHFHCRDTGEVHDVDLPADLIDRLRDLLPPGFEADHIELSFTGHRPAMAAAAADTPQPNRPHAT